ncbi:hypothetical protein [Rhizobium leguminosarum]|uniref:hypothetical protein n=1 Tax=Rhizobium leguminosarum TaxID=384 RepID=UPI000CF436E0|nr:hypothetical protein [Rhizobium leguminosarum]
MATFFDEFFGVTTDQLDDHGTLNISVIKRPTASSSSTWFATFDRRTSRIYSETFPKDGLITWARWVDIREPVAAVVEEAIGWRRRMTE